MPVSTVYCYIMLGNYHCLCQRNFARSLLRNIYPDIPLPLMQVMRRAKLRYSVLSLSIHHNGGLEKVQRETLSLIDNFSTTILTSTG